MGPLRIGVIINKGKNPDFIGDLISQLKTTGHHQIICIESSKSIPGLTFSENIVKFFCSNSFTFQNIVNVTKSDSIDSSESDNLDLLLNLSSSPFTTKSKIPVLSISILEGANHMLLPSLVKSISTKENVLQIFIKNQENKIHGFAKIKTILHSYRQSEKAAIRETLLLINQVIGKISTGNLQYLNIIQPVEKPELSVINFILAKWTSLIKQRFLNLFGSVKWNIGLIRLPIDEIAFSESKSIKVEWQNEARQSDFKADPFGIHENGNTWMLFEYFDAKKNKGILKLNKNTENAQILLEENYHLSYPYLFKAGNDWYCIPEKNKSHKVDLYKFNLTENNLIFHQTILQGIDAVDPSIVQYNGKYWLFCNDASNNGADLRLHIFYADSIDSSWKPHPLNPVKTDICSSRPAGTIFTKNGKLFRPSQDSSSGYGSSIVINEIIKLNADEFEELEIRRILPDKFSGIYTDGIHTFSTCGPYTLVDGKVIRYTIQNLFKRIFRPAL